MRVGAAVLILAVAACSRAKAGTAAPVAVVAPAPPPALEGALSGKLVERIDAGSYSYLRIAAPSGEVWAAVPTTDLQPGAMVSIAGPIWMKDFEGKAIGRKFPRIAFGTLAGVPAPAQAVAEPVSPVARPATAGFVHPSRAAAPDAGPVRVERAAGAAGRTVEQVFAKRAALAGRAVAVRGKVVKFTPGILGRNWVHLRDGSGTEGTNDLLVTTEDDCAVGDVVVARGIARTEQDFGAGYSYPVLIEGAKLKAR